MPSTPSTTEPHSLTPNWASLMAPISQSSLLYPCLLGQNCHTGSVWSHPRVSGEEGKSSPNWLKCVQGPQRSTSVNLMVPYLAYSAWSWVHGLGAGTRSKALLYPRLADGGASPHIKGAWPSHLCPHCPWFLLPAIL
jgi:hypothetical protein